MAISVETKELKSGVTLKTYGLGNGRFRFSTINNIGYKQCPSYVFLLKWIVTMSLFMAFSLNLLVSFSSLAQHKGQEAIFANKVIYVVSKKLSAVVKFCHG